MTFSEWLRYIRCDHKNKIWEKTTLVVKPGQIYVAWQTPDWTVYRWSCSDCGQTGMTAQAKVLVTKHVFDFMLEEPTNDN